MASLLQWYICGFHVNCEDISILLAHVNPTVVCLQENVLAADKTIKFNNYTTYCMPAVEANDTPRGVVAMLVKNGISRSQISLNTSLQAIALHITFHSHLWGCHKTTIRGKLIEDFLLKHNLSLLNDGSPTYFHPATSSLSAIDLRIADPSLFLDFSWSVDSDQHG